MNSLTGIQKKYENELNTISEYIIYVNKMFLTLCEIKSDLIMTLPSLYTSKYCEEISNNYEQIKHEILKQQETISSQLERIQEAIGVQDVSEGYISPYEPTADGDLLLYFYTEIAKGKSDRESLFRDSQVILEALCITKGPLIHGDRFYDLYDNSDEVYRLIDFALKNMTIVKKLQLQKDYDTLENIKKSLELFHFDNLMNIYRQCFIQTMSYFDSCVFELVEKCMKEDFSHGFTSLKILT